MWSRIQACVLALLLGALVPAHAVIDATNVASLVPKWEFTSGPVSAPLLLDGGRLYVPSFDGKLYALDPDTGTPVWTYAAGGPISGGVLPVPDGRVCFGTLVAQVHCVRASDGTLVWKKPVGTVPPDAVWSQLAFANGRLFVSIASQGDRPCTNGRLTALDAGDGHDLWTFQTVPDRICTTDTAIECSGDGDCPAGGTCIMARGGGVTATVALDPSGDTVYMNSVGCFTFPSVGESDSAFKIDAATGDVLWRRRVTPPEQFGYCINDSRVECGTDAHCASVGGTCRNPKAVYHDFGFLNGPLRLEVPADGGGTRTLIVSGSKNGTLYAFNEADGTIAWTNEVRPIPVSPGLAGFGLFNGALAYADGRLYAALYETIPNRVCDNDHARPCSADTGCGTGHCLPVPQHLMAFDPRNGDSLWEAEIGPSWSSVAVANGVVYAGTQVETDEETGASQFFAHDAATGARLATFALPASSTARALVTADTLFVGYGVLAPPGGVRAYTLPPSPCGNGQLDDGEACDPGAPGTAGCCSEFCRALPAATPCGADDGNACTADTCNASGACVHTLAAAGSPCGQDDGNPCTDDACNAAGACVRTDNASCDDGDACTSGDQCAAGACAGAVATTDGLGCVLDRVTDGPCGAEVVPATLARTLGARLSAVRRLLDKAKTAAAQGKTTKVERLRRAATTRLDKLTALTAKAVRSRQERRRISAACQDAIDGLVGHGRQAVSGFRF